MTSISFTWRMTQTSPMYPGQLATVCAYARDQPKKLPAMHRLLRRLARCSNTCCKSPPRNSLRALHKQWLWHLRRPPPRPLPKFSLRVASRRLVIASRIAARSVGRDRDDGPTSMARRRCHRGGGHRFTDSGAHVSLVVQFGATHISAIGGGRAQARRARLQRRIQPAHDRPRRIQTNHGDVLFTKRFCQHPCHARTSRHRVGVALALGLFLRDQKRACHTG